MGRAISQFMWGYQHTFRGSAQFGLREALKHIRADVPADLFLVGFDAAPVAGRWPICIEPEQGPYHPRQLATVQSRGDALYAANPERQIHYSDRRFQEIGQARLRDESRAKSLEEALELVDPGFVFRAGYSTLIGGYQVHTVVRLERASWEALPRLRQVSKDRIRVTRSLADGVVDEVLRLSRKALALPDPGFDLMVLDASVWDIGRAAGSRLAMSAAVLSGEWDSSNLMDELNALANTPYEGRVGSGELILVRDGHPTVEVELRFETPLKLRESRSVRKVLEMCGLDRRLLTNGKDVFGLGRIADMYDMSTEDLFIVRITGAGTWELHHGTQPLLRLQQGKTELPLPRVTRAQFEDVAIRRLASSGQRPNLEALWELAEAATQQIHGTMIIVSSEASAEASRLQPQAITVAPTRLTSELVASVTGIDGGVLLDPEGVCHAIGVIVDGRAAGAGDPARGSRFNTAMRYLLSDPPSCVILIVSEDGMIDILPKLQPQIPRGLVDQALEELIAATAHEAENPERFANAWKRVKELASYLDSEKCETANACWRSVDERRMQNGSLRVIEPPLNPNPEMNDSYFLD